MAGELAKVALVTGSSSGIGEATVKLLSQKGYQVVVVGFTKEKVERVAKECAELSPQKYQPLSLVLDFSNPENGEVSVKKTVEHFGRLDVLVNNAGTYIRSPQGDSSAAYDAYRRLMAINMDATVRATLAAEQYLRESKGNLVFVSSAASVKPSANAYAYCMSKAAMSSFAKCLAIDWAPDVRINIVSPGPVGTSIFKTIGLNDIETIKRLMDCTTLQDRIGTSEEIAKAIAFLISDDASFVHGHEMFVDGGYMLKPSTFSVAKTYAKAKEEGNI